MPAVTVSSKNQITLPAEIVRAMGIKPGQKLVLELVDGRIVALPEPASWADYMQGAGHTVYGTDRPTVDRYVAEERATWSVGDSPSDIEDFADYYAASQGSPVETLIDALAKAPWPFALTADAFAEAQGLAFDRVRQAMTDDLEPRRWVHRVELRDGQVGYRLRRDLADAVNTR